MPLYEYLCRKCGHRFEKLRQFSDKPIRKCPECGGAVEQLISASSVQFKGSGWYVSDYAKKGVSAASASSSSEGDSSTKETSEAKDSKDSKDTKKKTTEDKPKSDPSHKKHKED